MGTSRLVLVLKAPAPTYVQLMCRLCLFNPEVTDYYVCLWFSIFVCALNTAKNVAYPYARTVRLSYTVLYRTAYGTVRYGTIRYHTGTVGVHHTVPNRTVRYRTDQYRYVLRYRYRTGLPDRQVCLYVRPRIHTLTLYILEHNNIN